MQISRLSIGTACCLLIFATATHAQNADSPAALAVKIDRLLAKRWANTNLKPAARADDAEFVRRIHLDLAGRIPTVAETREFLADTQPDRRQRLIERLLASPRYATHFAALYRALLIPEAGNNFFVRFQQDSFEAWLRLQLPRKGFDQITHELLTAPVGAGGPLVDFGGNGGPSPAAFYAAKEFKPESLAAGAARVFLGLRVECAQCHNHPFADWKKEQFWGLAAFFSGIQAQQGGDVTFPGQEMPLKRDLKIPGTETVVKARFLDGTQPNWQQLEKTPTRNVLANWITSRNNPYFARAAVNRMWANFLGAGLVEPIDDMIGAGAASSHPELLDLLARSFVAHDFDLKFLVRAITLTEAYQRTSAGTDKNQGEPANFARMPLRGLTPEQLFDSLVTATGFRGGDGKENFLDVIAGKTSPRGQILAKFANQTERPTMAQTSILHALTLMNGKIVTDATSLKHGETLAALIDAPFLSTAERIDTLYLAALSRRPTERESIRMTRFVDDAVRDANSMRDKAYSDALGDVFWVLLNGAEFALNH